MSSGLLVLCKLLLLHTKEDIHLVDNFFCIGTEELSWSIRGHPCKYQKLAFLLTISVLYIPNLFNPLKSRRDTRVYSRCAAFSMSAQRYSLVRRPYDRSDDKRGTYNSWLLEMAFHFVPVDDRVKLWEGEPPVT